MKRAMDIFLLSGVHIAMLCLFVMLFGYRYVESGNGYFNDRDTRMIEVICISYIPIVIYFFVKLFIDKKTGGAK